MNRKSLLRASALLIAAVPLVAGCQSTTGSPPAGGGQPTVSDRPTAPTALLSKVFYNDLPAQEYGYDASGRPVSQKSYHPVTGALRTESTVVSLNEARQVTEVTVTGEGGDVRAVYTYGGNGDRAGVRRIGADGKTIDSIDYVKDGNVITQSNKDGAGTEKRKIIYTLDARGDVVSQNWITGGVAQKHVFSGFDDAPNPYRLTSQLHSEYPLSAHNYQRDVNYAGCESNLVHTYNAAGLLTQTDITGCKGPTGKVITHQYRYEYVTR